MYLRIEVKGTQWLVYLDAHLPQKQVSINGLELPQGRPELRLSITIEPKSGERDEAKNRQVLISTHHSICIGLGHRSATIKCPL